jgi:hypothetical protein
MTVQEWLKQKGCTTQKTAMCACGTQATVVKGGIPSCDRCAGVKAYQPKSSGKRLAKRINRYSFSASVD